MFRKIALIAVPAAAFAIMLCASDNSASQAFARGGRGGNGGHSFHNYRGNHSRYFGRYYGWGSSYGYDYPTYGYATVVEPQAPVYTTSEPVYNTYYGSNWGWGYGHYRNHYGRFGGYGGHGGHDRRR